ncbi:hypothetical protein FRC04_006117 [Tulasnella sp. 424]|nr:hypothetical protein FRC04_006117 [Tulasnella sp. 424]
MRVPALKVPLSGSSGSEAGDGGDVGDVPTNGHKPAKAMWAFEQFEPTPVREYDKEPLPHPKSSNFISHLKQPTCPIPEEFSFKNRGKEQPETSGSAGPLAGYVAQRKMILDFTVQGKIAPAQKFTKEGFRTAFIKGVVEDGLPFTFGEGRGMKKLFEYSLPEVSLPNHMSVRRELDVLYTALQSELWARLKSLKSCPSIAFDIWSS